MGCSASSPQVESAAKKPKPKPVLPSQTIMVVEASSNDAEERCLENYNKITSMINTVVAPANLLASVCFSKEAFPILCAPLSDEEDPICLPIISASFTKNSGKMVVFSQLTFLTNLVLQKEQTMKLITRCINWACGGKAGDTPIPIFTGSDEITNVLIDALARLELVPKDDLDLTEAKIAIVTDDFDLTDNRNFGNLLDFAYRGGGLLIFHNHTSDDSPSTINNLLQRFGLSFSTAIINQDIQEPLVIEMPSEFDLIKNFSFLSSLDELAIILDECDTDVLKLDRAVTTARFYIAVSGSRQTQLLLDIAQRAWTYLNETNYSASEGICPEIYHQIVLLLLQEIYPILPLRTTPPIPDVKTFPGDAGEIDLKFFLRTLQFKDSSWVSTGLYSPPRIVGIVNSPEEHPGLCIQIGSHTESLISKSGPWKRWPIISCGYPMNDTSIDIGSAFGGIVYASYAGAEESNQQITLEFRNFTEYPRYIESDKSIWESTQNNQVPWGEIETGSVIFTLPSAQMRKLNLPKVCAFYEDVMSIVNEFLGIKDLPHPARVVFDIELADDNCTFGYPIVKLESDIPPLLINFNQQSECLFETITNLTRQQLRENTFSSEIEDMFGRISACLVFKKLFHGFDPIVYKGNNPLPVLFKEMWHIHNLNPKIIPGAFDKMNDPSFHFSAHEIDNWNSFVHEMCTFAEYDFTKVLSAYKPIPLNASANLKQFPVFQMT